MTSDVHIKPLMISDIEQFFLYLDDHISDNGRDDSPLFLPISRNDLSLSKALITKFKKGLKTSIGELGWRRGLLAMNTEDQIVGHIDLRSDVQKYTAHRAILGMGVHRDYRKMGIGRLLIQSVTDWALKESTIERVDLWVLSNNLPALKLYQKLDFKIIAEVEDLFRIDGVSQNSTMMTKKIR